MGAWEFGVGVNEKCEGIGDGHWVRVGDIGAQQLWVEGKGRCWQVEGQAGLVKGLGFRPHSWSTRSSPI